MTIAKHTGRTRISQSHQIIGGVKARSIRLAVDGVEGLLVGEGDVAFDAAIVEGVRLLPRS